MHCRAAFAEKEIPLTFRGWPAFRASKAALNMGDLPSIFPHHTALRFLSAFSLSILRACAAGFQPDSPYLLPLTSQLS